MAFWVGEALRRCIDGNLEHAEFWSLIDEARATRNTAKTLERLLTCIPAVEILAFEGWFQAYYSAVSRQDLWAAVYLIRGGCSDDAFDYFRAWLIGQGASTLLAAVRDPETLAGCVGDDDPRDEALLGVARKAHDQLVGTTMPDDHIVREVPNLPNWPADRIPVGLRWTEAFLREQFPKLYARYEEPRVRARGPAPTGAIEHERFWAIIEEARAQNPAAVVPALERHLATLPIAELVGFDRWLQSYNRALMRNDLRAVCRIVLGSDDAELFSGFRGWLLAAGEQAVRAAVHDPDSLVELTEGGVTPLARMIFVTRAACERARIYPKQLDEPDAIPNADAWCADWAVAAYPFTPEVLRARLPRLSANRTDAALTGAYDPSALPASERETRALALLARARTTGDTTALELLDEAVVLSPMAALFQRGRAHTRLRNFDAALADFDAAIRNKPDAAGALFERAKLLDARGQGERALDDARRALALGLTDARRWVEEHSRVAPPKRVRHPKFGDGNVVAIEGGDKQTLVIEFSDGRKKLAARFVEVLE